MRIGKVCVCACILRTVGVHMGVRMMLLCLWYPSHRRWVPQVSEFEGGSQTKERELRDFMQRVSAVTNQYLGRLEHTLRDEETVQGGELVKGEDGDDDGKEKNPRSNSQSARYIEMEKRAADAEAALQIQQQAHAAVMLRMQAEVQSLQDQVCVYVPERKTESERAIL